MGFGDNFLKWVHTFYSCRKSYVLNNGLLTESISMNTGIFQGCPISPYIFLFVMETIGIAIRDNQDIQGILVDGQQLKVSMLADDTTCFIDGSTDSFHNLFSILWICFHKFHLSKSEAIWIEAKKGSPVFPSQNKGLHWNTSKFKCLGGKVFFEFK